MVIALKSGEKLQTASYRAALKEADYKVRDIRLKATGDVFVHPEKKPGGFSDLRFRVLDQVFPVVPPSVESKTQKKQQTESAGLVSGLRESVKVGKQKFTITGKIWENAEGVEGILLEHILSGHDQNAETSDGF